MILESPKALVGDGGLIAWAIYVATHFAAGVVWALTIGILLLRTMILLRQWRAGK
jgi:hypothetical protein